MSSPAQQGRLLHADLFYQLRVVLYPPVLLKCKDPLLTLPALGEVDRGTHELVLLGCGLGNDVTIWVDDAGSGYESPVVLLPSLGGMNAVAGILVAPCLA